MIECPKWVPFGVRTSLRLVIFHPIFKVEAELIDRLLTNPRMEAVWRSLGNPKKCAASSAVRDLWPETDVPDGMSDQELAVALFFFYSCVYAHLRLPIITGPALAKTRKEYLESANRLQEETQLLRSRWPKDRDAKALATALDASIDFYKQKAKHIFDPSPRLVARSQGDPYQRAYAVYMAGMARQLFGKPMYKTIARVTNVALVDPRKRQVSKDNVYEWCKASVRVRGRSWPTGSD